MLLDAVDGTRRAFTLVYIGSRIRHTQSYALCTPYITEDGFVLLPSLSLSPLFLKSSRFSVVFRGISCGNWRARYTPKFPLFFSILIGWNWSLEGSPRNHFLLKFVILCLAMWDLRLVLLLVSNVLVGSSIFFSNVYLPVELFSDYVYGVYGKMNLGIIILNDESLFISWLSHVRFKIWAIGFGKNG